MIEIEKPRIVRLEKGDARYGKFVVEPLERGGDKEIAQRERSVRKLSPFGFVVSRNLDL